jgi:outer membrane protein TolC
VRDESRTSLINPFYEQQVQLEVVQPLLKNFGPTVTNANIRIARHQEEISRYGVLAEIDTQVAQAMQTYWDLVFTIENLSVQQLFLKQAEDLLRINRIKFETGVLSQTDVLQAEAQVATGQESVIVAQSAIIAVQDQLKRLMDPTRDLSDWNRPLVPEDLPQETPVEVDEEEAIQDALANRPEILQSEEQIRIAEIGRSVADWQRLPELNVFGSYNINGGGPTSKDAWDTVEDNNYNSYQAGVELRYPLLNRKARAEYQQSQKQLEIARKSLENLESVVTVEVRNALRELRTGRERIQATRSAVESEQAKLDAELKRYDVGMSTSFEVLTFQQDLADARVNHLNSLVRYNKALIELDRVRSRLRDRLLEMGVPVELLRTRTEEFGYDPDSGKDQMNESQP